MEKRARSWREVGVVVVRRRFEEVEKKVKSCARSMGRFG